MTRHTTAKANARNRKASLNFGGAFFYYNSDAITPATASSGLPVAYTFDPENILAFENGAFTILSEGTVTVTASQTGNTVYNAAESLTRIITVNPAQTYFTYEAQICEGDAWSDEHFDALTDGGTYYDTIPNVYGGDSIITLELTVHPVYGFDQNLTMYIGAEETWQNTDLSIFPLGDTLLMAPYTTVHGCDSVYTLHLSVIPRPVTYGADTISLCAGEKAVYEGKTYKRPTTDSVRVSMPNQFGGDSIVVLVVQVFPAMHLTASKTIAEGDTVMWQDIDLSTFPIGDTILVAEYLSVHGCDSTYTLYLTVTENILTAIDHQEAHIGTEVRKILKNGVLFIRKGDDTYDLYGRKIE